MGLNQVGHAGSRWGRTGQIDLRMQRVFKLTRTFEHPLSYLTILFYLFLRALRGQKMKR
ncbi:MAG: hypothetical protein RIS70_529 [Planctomycetota bacterium]|jgi:hypothetical protein